MGLTLSHQHEKDAEFYIAGVRGEKYRLSFWFEQGPSTIFADDLDDFFHFCRHKSGRYGFCLNRDHSRVDIPSRFQVYEQVEVVCTSALGF